MGDQEVGVPNEPLFTNYFDISLSQVILPDLSDDPIINEIFDDKSDDILDDCFVNGFDITSAPVVNVDKPMNEEKIMNAVKETEGDDHACQPKTVSSSLAEFRMFRVCLEKHDAFKELFQLPASFKGDPDKDIFAYPLIKTVTGEKSDQKYRILNACLKIYLAELLTTKVERKGRGGITEMPCVQPGTMRKKFFAIFSVLKWKKCGVQYKLGDFKKVDDSFMCKADAAAIKLGKTVKNFGRTYTRPTLDHRTINRRLRTCKLFLPESDALDLLLVILFMVGCCFLLRGVEEHYELLWDMVDIGWLSLERSHAAGYPRGTRVKFVRLRLGHRKNDRVTVSAASSATTSDDGFEQLIYENPNDPWCVVKLITMYRLHCEAVQIYFYSSLHTAKSYLKRHGKDRYVYIFKSEFS